MSMIQHLNYALHPFIATTHFPIRDNHCSQQLIYFLRYSRQNKVIQIVIGEFLFFEKILCVLHCILWEAESSCQLKQRHLAFSITVLEIFFMVLSMHFGHMPSSQWITSVSISDSFFDFHYICMLTVEQGLPNFFSKGPDNVYFRLCRPSGFLQLSSAILAQKRPQTLEYGTVAVLP